MCWGCKLQWQTFCVCLALLFFSLCSFLNSVTQTVSDIQIMAVPAGACSTIWSSVVQLMAAMPVKKTMQNWIYIYVYIYYIILYISSRCSCILEGLFNSWSTYVQIKACNYKEHVLFFRDRKKTPPNIKVATCLSWPWTETYTIRRWQPCHFAISFIRLKKSVIVLLLVKFMIFFSRVSNLMSL